QALVRTRHCGMSPLQAFCLQAGCPNVHNWKTCLTSDSHHQGRAEATVKIALGAMSIGDMLDRGFKILLGRLSTFYLINLVVFSPILVIGFVMPPQNALGLGMGGLLERLLQIELSPIATAATLYVISREYLGQSAGAGDALRFAIGRFGRLLWASFLAGIIIMVGGLLCIPAFIFMVWYIFVGQVVVMENLG